jgi:hypothetical protein
VTWPQAGPEQRENREGVSVDRPVGPAEGADRCPLRLAVARPRGRTARTVLRGEPTAAAWPVEDGHRPTPTATRNRTPTYGTPRPKKKRRGRSYSFGLPFIIMVVLLVIIIAARVFSARVNRLNRESLEFFSSRPQRSKSCAEKFCWPVISVGTPGRDEVRPTLFNTAHSNSTQKFDHMALHFFLASSRLRRPL